MWTNRAGRRAKERTWQQSGPCGGWEGVSDGDGNVTTAVGAMGRPEEQRGAEGPGRVVWLAVCCHNDLDCGEIARTWDSRSTSVHLST